MSEIKERIWSILRQEVSQEAEKEPILASFLFATVLNHKSFEEALGFHLATKLSNQTIHSITLRDVMQAAYADDPQIVDAAVADLCAVCERDPACRNYSTPFLYFKGYHALQSYRLSHYLWTHERQALALQLQSRISETFSVDIHPAARIGQGILMDHATGIVVGETAVIEDCVSMLHEVTLGGTGKETGDRHPKIRRGCMIGAGAKILGNIEIGEGAVVGGGSVVLQPVPPHTTVVGVPARPIGTPRVSEPSKEMDQMVDKRCG